MVWMTELAGLSDAAHCTVWWWPTLLCEHGSTTVIAVNSTACCVLSDHGIRVLSRHGIRRDQMSLLVNTTRYVADASEAVGKTRCIGTWWSGRTTTVWRLHSVAFWSSLSLRFIPNKSAQTVSGDVASKRPRNFLSLVEISLDFPQALQDTSGLVLQDLL
jgi:hypothetical protein